MPWSEVSLGHYQRPIGENESFIRAIGDRGHAVGREHWSVTAYATFSIHRPQSKRRGDDELSDELRQAWKLLRFEHPSIASTAGVDTLDYIVPGIEALEEWARETFTVHIGTGKQADEVIAKLKPARYVTAHYFPSTSQILIHQAHWRTDGFGALHLVNALFGAWSQLSEVAPHELPWGQEASRLVPSVEEALDLPMEATADIQSAADRYFGTTARMQGSVGLIQTQDATKPPAGTRSVRVRLSQKKTEAITVACQQRGISVLSAVHASTAAATYTFAPEQSRKMPYTSTVRLSIRPYLPPPYNTAVGAAGIYTGGYMVEVPASQNWLENALQYNNEYEYGATTDFLRSRRQYAQTVMRSMQQHKQPNGTTTSETVPLPSAVDISSVDNASQLVSRYHKTRQGTVEVESLSIGVETLTRQMFCFVWTFSGKLEFNLVYNEAFYTVDFARSVVEEVERSLERELGIIVE